MPNPSLSKKLQLSYCAIEKEIYPQLIGCIRAILEEGESHNAERFNQEAWYWRYQDLPTHMAYIYAAAHANRIHGYYHIPMYQGLVEGEPKNFAMVQDVAVSRALRGQGVFRRLADYATDQIALTQADLLYTFPNHRSIHTFLKYNGYTEIKTLDTYLLPLETAKIIQSKKNLFGLEHLLGGVVDSVLRPFSRRMVPDGALVQYNSVNDNLADVFKAYQKTHSIALKRDENYLNWRYTRKPLAKHYILALKNNTQITAVTIFKSENIMDNPALLLMDFAYVPGHEVDVLAILSEIRRHPTKYLEEPVNLIFTAGCSSFFRQLKRIGFVKIPPSVNPRPLKLLVKNLKLPDADIIFDSDNWHVTLSDWDVL